MATTQVKADNSDTIYTVKHAIDLRRRMDPPLSEHHIGNYLYVPVVAEPHIDDEDNYRCGVINQMRRTVKSVDSEYAKKLANEADEHLKLMKEVVEMQGKKKVVTLIFTSWCRLPVHEIDFGWGKPEWLGTPSWPYQNLFVLCDTKEKGGIEIFAHMVKEEMAKLEKDDELAAFASPLCQI
ncbi:hypothetical protein K2173_019498 [Erythroxylum novogranatense]|uniref:Uncharacterized protein n=1 Tax=Erythroxylum novogranatense TaxID=1862640 RepID=A0AAV8UFE3_9ROSI|nr:hypothetical protein K2173_019498 [Erythroxylum novogranatense]